MNNRKIILTIIIFLTGSILLITGLFINYNSKDDKKEPSQNENNKENSDKEKEHQDNDRLILYSCKKQSDSGLGTIMDSLYEFGYDESIVNPIRKLVVTFDSYEKYKSIPMLDPDKTNDKPDEILYDDSKLTQTYIWKSMHNYDSENFDVNEYVKELESNGYNCIID